MHDGLDSLSARQALRKALVARALMYPAAIPTQPVGKGRALWIGETVFAVGRVRDVLWAVTVSRMHRACCVVLYVIHGRCLHLP